MYPSGGNKELYSKRRGRRGVENGERSRVSKHRDLVCDKMTHMMPSASLALVGALLVGSASGFSAAQMKAPMRTSSRARVSRPALMVEGGTRDPGDELEFSEEAMQRMTMRLNGMLRGEREASEESLSSMRPAQASATPFIDAHFPGRKELAEQRRRVPAALAALVQKLDRLGQQAEASVDETDEGYTIRCYVPGGADPSKLTMSVDGGGALIISGQTLVDVGDGASLQIDWALPIELPPDADLRPGANIVVEFDGDMIIRVPKASLASSS